MKVLDGDAKLGSGFLGSRDSRRQGKSECQDSQADSLLFGVLAPWILPFSS